MKVEAKDAVSFAMACFAAGFMFGLIAMALSIGFLRR
jgi:hypothetical protein